MSQPLRLFPLFAVSVVLVVSGCAATKQPAPASFNGTGQVVIRNAALVLTMDPKIGDGPLGQLHDADVLIDHDRIGAVGKHYPLVARWCSTDTARSSCRAL